ncbi:extracellular solute-binding protein [Actinocorallia glomerata]|uniref:Extracellular solute-binding protein n=3 Tax=Actinomycetota TaxID=201174 RepID=A0ABP6M8G4_9MICC
MESFEVGDTFVATEPVDFSLLYRDHPEYPMRSDWAFFEHLEENNNVTLSPENAPLSDWNERVSLVIGAGDAPDFIPVMYSGGETQYVGGGALLPVSDYLEHMPHFSEKIENWDLEEDINSLYQADGKFYLLPGLHESTQDQYSVVVRWDIWEELGYDEPETWDEFEEQLRGVKEAYPDMIPFSDRWQLESTLSVAGPNFGTQAGWGYEGHYWDAEAEEFIYTAEQDEYRDLLEYFHGLIEEGLIDSESLTQDDDQAIQKFASGQSAVLGGNDQAVVTYRSSIDEVGDDDMEIRQIRVPAGPAGDIAPGGQTESGLVISSSVAEKEYFVALLQFIDWLYYSDEGLEFAKWGVEGETFERDGDERVLVDDIDIHGLNPDGDEHLQVDYGFANGVFMPAHGSTTELVQSMLRDEVVEFREAMAEKDRTPVAPAAPLDELELERVSLLANSLDDTVATATAQFLTGQRDLDDWDSFVSELQAQGTAEYLEVYNEAYQRAQEEIDGIEEDMEG